MKILLKLAFFIVLALSLNFSCFSKEPTSINPKLLKLMQTSCDRIDNANFHSRECLNRSISSMLASRLPQRVLLDACDYFNGDARGNGDEGPVVVYNRCLSSLLVGVGLEKEQLHCAAQSTYMAYRCYVHELSSEANAKKINSLFSPDQDAERISGVSDCSGAISSSSRAAKPKTGVTPNELEAAVKSNKGTAK